MFKNIEFSAKKKQEALLMSIWRKNSRMIYQTCLKICQDHEMAKDLRQEIFIKLFNHVHVLKDFKYKEAWIHYVCRNHCLDFIRKQKIRPEFHLKEVIEDYQVVGDDFRLERALDFKIEQAFSVLNVIDRMILELYFMGGLSTTDIANYLGISKSGVALRIKNALKKASFIFEEVEE